jgi:tetratricopeptide (TPR) repeat protein
MRSSILMPALVATLVVCSSGAVLADDAVTSEIRRNTIEELSERLKDYVFPDIGARVADQLEANLESGRYDQITDFREFAGTVNEDMFAISNDRHLIIRYAPGEILEMKKNQEPTPERKIAARAQAKAASARDNHGFAEARVLPGNIGYLKLNEFERSAHASETMAAAMTFVGNSDVLILDLRTNNGGWPSGTHMMISYFFEYEDLTNNMLLLEQRTPCTGEVVQDRLLPSLPGERIVEQPVYILTSNRTYSAAEVFTDVLQKRGRATVVGETTRGGANGTRGPEVLTDYYIVKMPVTQMINPVTGSNWEGTGIEPDVRTEADKSLDKALQLALSRIIERDPSEAFLNNLGYSFISEGTVEPALHIFGLMVEKYPSSANAYDSLGEAYMIRGDHELAIRNYRRSLELDPNNENAVNMIEKMQKNQSGE